MKFLAPLVFLLMTALFAPREAEENKQATAAAEKEPISVTQAATLAEPVAEFDTEKYGELVESPGLLNSITLFGY
jgi:predicted metalloprotease with PDZ domain